MSNGEKRKLIELLTDDEQLRHMAKKKQAASNRRKEKLIELITADKELRKGT